MGRRFNPKDAYFRRAKAEGYRARSAYKLEELAEKHRFLLKRGATVLDLGAAPGGFLQVIAERVGPSGRVVGVDLQPIAGLVGVTTLEADVYDPRLGARLRAEAPEGFDSVVTDMAPATTGASATDVARSHALVERALELASEVLRPGGGFCAKVFMGPGFEKLVEVMRSRFEAVKIERPDATRKRSRECFVVGRGFR